MNYTPEYQQVSVRFKFRCSHKKLLDTTEQSYLLKWKLEIIN